MASLPESAQANDAQISTATVTETVRPVEPAVTITATKPPTLTAIAVTSKPSIALQIFYYSYYNPNLLAPSDIVNGVRANQENGMCLTVNCWEYDVIEGRCKSKIASGLDWHDYVGRALAWRFEYLLRTIFRVLKPEELAGEYICMDRCPACSGKNHLDFI